MTEKEQLAFYRQFLEDIAFEEDPNNYGPTLPVLAAKALSLDMGCDGCIFEYRNNKKNIEEGEVPCGECEKINCWFPSVDYVNEYFDLLCSEADEE